MRQAACALLIMLNLLFCPFSILLALDVLSQGETLGSLDANTTVSYLLDLTEPRIVTLYLESDDFDPFLEVWVYSETGTKGDTYEPHLESQITYVAGNDDASEDDANSRVEVSLPAGKYEVEVSANFSAMSGGYALHFTSRLQGDRDNDGILDVLESATPGPYQANPWLADSDGDGLSDGEEIGVDGAYAAGTETNARDADTDGDGLSDGVEVRILHTDPLNNLSPASFVDEDSDGLPRTINGDTTTVFDVDDHNADVDEDGYSDGYEAALLGLAAAEDSDQHPSLGDLNGNGQIDLADLLLLKFLLAGTVQLSDAAIGNMSAFDLNGNGLLDDGDLGLLKSILLEDRQWVR